MALLATAATLADGQQVFVPIAGLTGGPANGGGGSGGGDGLVNLNTASPEELEALVDAVLATEGLRLRGVMAVAPLDADPDEAFARLAGLAAAVREQAPEATWLSAGMSGDLEHAVRCGATHVRVGSAVLGNRPVPR